jgi:hypothetical protein
MMMIMIMTELFVTKGLEVTETFQGLCSTMLRLDVRTWVIEKQSIGPSRYLGPIT